MRLIHRTSIYRSSWNRFACDGHDNLIGVETSAAWSLVEKGGGGEGREEKEEEDEEEENGELMHFNWIIVLLQFTPDLTRIFTPSKG